MATKDTPMITTVKLQQDTKDRIDKLRVHSRETYDEILQRMLALLNTARTNPERARGALIRIERTKRQGKKVHAHSVPLEQDEDEEEENTSPQRRSMPRK